MIGRRGFTTGLVSFVAAPAIVRVGSIMPVRVMEPEFGVGLIVEGLTIQKIIDAKRMLRYGGYDWYLVGPNQLHAIRTDI